MYRTEHDGGESSQPWKSVSRRFTTYSIQPAPLASGGVLFSSVDVSPYHAIPEVVKHVIPGGELIETFRHFTSMFLDALTGTAVYQRSDWLDVCNS